MFVFELFHAMKTGLTIRAMPSQNKCMQARDTSQTQPPPWLQRRWLQQLCAKPVCNWLGDVFIGQPTISFLLQLHILPAYQWMDNSRKTEISSKTCQVKTCSYSRGKLCTITTATPWHICRLDHQSSASVCKCVDMDHDISGHWVHLNSQTAHDSQ